MKRGLGSTRKKPKKEKFTEVHPNRKNNGAFFSLFQTNSKPQGNIHLSSRKEFDFT